jgi:hypothetical protein
MSSLTFSLIFLIVFLIVHQIEEVKTDFRKRNPIGEISQPLFIGINILICLYCVVMLFFSFRSNPMVVPMAWIFAIAMLLNGLGHTAMMIIKKTYFPGGITGLILIPAALYVIRVLMG